MHLRRHELIAELVVSIRAPAIRIGGEEPTLRWLMTQRSHL
jgi:hypothetical protein